MYVNGNLLKISEKDADAINMHKEAPKTNTIVDANAIVTEEDAWNVMKTCYDPEIPVNVVDLGLVYDLKLDKTKNDLKEENSL